MGQLFDKPLNELREAFVRARFAEANVFKREDIEEWLEGQRGNLRNGVDHDPWTSSGFSEYMLEAWRNTPRVCEEVATILDTYTYATASTNRPAWTEQDDATSRFVEVIELLRAGGAQVFYATNPGKLMYDPWAIVIINGKAYRAVHHTSRGENCIVSLLRTDILDCVNTLLQEVRNRRPKAQRAHNCLLSALKCATQDVREAAQRDFDEAVAVSADGTKIVKARWVLVGSDDEHWKGRAILYPAEVFRGQKIKISGKRTRQGINMSHLGGLDYTMEGRNLVVNLLQLLFRNMTKTRSPWNLYLEDETGGSIFESLYLTDFRSCPSPLPEGGQEIKV